MLVEIKPLDGDNFFLDLDAIESVSDLFQECIVTMASGKQHRVFMDARAFVEFVELHRGVKSKPPEITEAIPSCPEENVSNVRAALFASQRMGAN